MKVTPGAAKEISRRLKGMPAHFGIRIYVRGFGWGGPSLGLALGEPKETDISLQEGGALIHLERRVAEAYDGAELDWEGDQWGGGFTFRHPDLSEC